MVLYQVEKVLELESMHTSTDFLAEENVRIRRNPIEFTIRPPTPEDEGESLSSYSDLSKDYDGFKLTADAGEIFHDEIV
ncbi:hypothetical protein LEA_01637, partial [human gut metagenome]